MDSDGLDDIGVDESRRARDSDSPSGWTIEAIDGELSEKEDVRIILSTLHPRISLLSIAI